MSKKFFSSRKNVITFAVAISLALAIIAVVVSILFIKTPKPEYINATVGDFAVYYDKNGVDKDLTITAYVGDAEDYKVTVPEIIKIGDYEYEVIKLDSKSFSGAENEKLKDVTEIILPSTIREIGEKAFEDTVLLEELEIKGLVKTYGSYIFVGSGIKTLTIENLLSGYAANTFTGTAEKPVRFNKVIINNIVGDTDEYLDHFTMLDVQELSFGEDVRDVSMFSYIINKVKTLTINASTIVDVQKITSPVVETLYLNKTGRNLSAESFNNISSLMKSNITTIYLGADCKEISAQTFVGFSNLESVYVDGDLNINLDAFLGENTCVNTKIYFNRSNIGLTLSSGTTNTEITEAFINRLGVEKIGKVSIKNGVTAIRGNSFKACTALTEVHFHTECVIGKIGLDAFASDANTKIHFYGPVDTTSTTDIYSRLVEYFGITTFNFN